MIGGSRDLIGGLVLGALLAAGCAPAPEPIADGDPPPVELRILSSPGFAAAAEIIGERFASQTGVTVTTERLPSTGAVVGALEEDGSAADIAILGVDGMDSLEDAALISPDSRARLGSTGVGVAVRAGEPEPDVSTLDALADALRSAGAVAYSAGPSGTHIADVVLPRLGLQVEVSAKSIRTSAVPDSLMSGAADIGFQQMSELIPVEGIQYVGPLPDEVQNRTPYDAAITAGSANPELVQALLEFLGSPEVDDVVARMGLER